MNNPKEKPQIIFNGGPLDSTRPPVHMQVFASYDVDTWARNKGVRPDVGTYIAATVDGGKVVMEWKGVTP